MLRRRNGDDPLAGCGSGASAELLAIWGFTVIEPEVVPSMSVCRMAQVLPENEASPAMTESVRPGAYR